MKCKNPECNEEVVACGIGAPKLFHDSACKKAYHAKLARERKFKGARLADHTITGVDESSRLGHCSQCGPETPVLKGGGKKRVGRWRCANQVYAKRAERGPTPPRDPAAERIRQLRKQGIEISKAGLRYLEARAEGHCENCRQEKRLEVDHDHDTHQVRGLLCGVCNRWLGRLGDDAAGLQRVVQYLAFPPRIWAGLRIIPVGDRGAIATDRPKQPRHNLTEKDELARTAVCSICGPVKIYGGHVVGSYQDGQVRRVWWCSNRAKDDQNRRNKTARGRERKWRSQGMKHMSHDLWHALLVVQNGRCAICEEPMKEPQTDHDHHTHEVRGLLCVPCNTGLGYAGEDELGAIQKWFKYLAFAEAENVSGRFPSDAKLASSRPVP